MANTLLWTRSPYRFKVMEDDPFGNGFVPGAKQASTIKGAFEWLDWQLHPSMSGPYWDTGRGFNVVYSRGYCRQTHLDWWYRLFRDRAPT